MDKEINFNSVADVHEYLIDNEYFTEEELNLVTSINGWCVASLNDCIYVRYGYHDLEQMLEAEGNV